ncbi:hypothetical protein OG233_00440 [Streptomyces sp. NBC_01218]|nr:hypothetical protein OG233_00440 [Streptomyces sp. NBC_01218]
MRGVANQASVQYDSSGTTVSFAENSDGTLATRAGYCRDLVKNSAGTSR